MRLLLLLLCVSRSLAVVPDEDLPGYWATHGQFVKYVLNQADFPDLQEDDPRKWYDATRMSSTWEVPAAVPAPFVPQANSYTFYHAALYNEDGETVFDYRPVLTSFGAADAEFGQGFYTTTSLVDAQSIGNHFFSVKKNRDDWYVLRLEIPKNLVQQWLVKGGQRDQVVPTLDYYLTHSDLGQTLATKAINQLNKRGDVQIFNDLDTKVACGRKRDHLKRSWSEFQQLKSCGSKSAMLIIGHHKSGGAPCRQYAFTNDAQWLLNHRLTKRSLAYIHAGKRGELSQTDPTENKNCTGSCIPTSKGLVKGGGAWREEISDEKGKRSEYEIRFVQKDSRSRDSLGAVLTRWGFEPQKLTGLDKVTCNRTFNDLLLVEIDGTKEASYISCFNNWSLTPEWTMHVVSPSTMGEVPISDIHPWRVRKFTDQTYDGSGDSFVNPRFGRGMLVPLGDFTASRSKMDSLYHAINRVPVWDDFQVGGLAEIEQQIRLDVYSNNRPLLVMTHAFNGNTRIKEQTSREEIPGKSIWIPYAYVKSIWAVDGKRTQLYADSFMAQFPNDTAPANFPNVEPKAPVPFVFGNGSQALSWTNDLESLRDYCDPFSPQCRLDAMIDCTKESYKVQVPIELYWDVAIDKARVLFNNYFLMAVPPCPASCALNPTSTEWLIEMDVNSRRTLEKVVTDCLRKTERSDCFTSGKEISQRAFNFNATSLLDIEEDPMVGLLSATCGTGKLRSFKAPFTKSPLNGKAKASSDTPDMARSKAFFTS